MPGEEVENDNIEGSNDLSDTTQKLNELVDIILKDKEEKKKIEQEQKKKEEEQAKKDKELEQKSLEELQKEKESSSYTMQTLVDNTTYLESINSLLQEGVFLGKMSFVGLGVGIALISVMIFQNSFRR